MRRTVEHLKALRADLVRQRREQVYELTEPLGRRIESVAHLHLAIQAIDAVIAEGLPEPEGIDGEETFDTTPQRGRRKPYG